MTKRQFAEPRVSLYPKPVVIVTSIGNDGRIGATTIAWTGIVSSQPPTIAVSFLPDSFTRACVLESREFVVNVPDATLVRETNYLGSVSGSWDEKSDGMRVGVGSALTLADSAAVRPPRIEECYLNFECRVLNSLQMGLYDSFFGEIITMHCSDMFFLGDHARGNIDHERVQPIFCLGDEYWSGGTKLGVSTENKNHPYARR